MASVGFVSPFAIAVILWRVSSRKQVSVCTNYIFWMYRVLCFRFPGLDVDHLGSVICFPNICFWMYRGFRHESFDPPVTVWRVSSMQPKMAERKFRQGSILLYLIG